MITILSEKGSAGAIVQQEMLLVRHCWKVFLPVCAVRAKYYLFSKKKEEDEELGEFSLPRVG